jgi:hypothetical protein
MAATPGREDPTVRATIALYGEEKAALSNPHRVQSFSFGCGDRRRNSKRIAIKIFKCAGWERVVAEEEEEENYQTVHILRVYGRRIDGSGG